MTINFFDQRCQTTTNSPKFGLCDKPSPSNDPAYLDILNEDNWFAIVENINQLTITFTAIDNCIKIIREDGKMDNRCDRMLTYPYPHATKCTIIFVELKDRDYKNIVWIEDGEKQLRSTIRSFLEKYDLADYKPKKAYIANKKKPYFQVSHQTRMRQFKNETGFILMIQNAIKIEV